MPEPDSAWDASRLRAAVGARAWDYVILAARIRELGGTVHPVTVSRWLSGTHEPKITDLAVVARVLGVPLESLVVMDA